MEKTDVEILKEVLKENNFSIDYFVVYKTNDSITQYHFAQPNEWYLIEGGSITALRISEAGLTGIKGLEKLKNLKELDLNLNESLKQVDLTWFDKLEKINLSACHLKQLIISSKVKGRIEISDYYGEVEYPI